MMINEGLPDYIIKNILKNNAIKNKKIGILGMAFKAEVDDIRDSLSFKLRKILSFHGANVMCSDEYYEDESFYSTQDIISECKIIIIGAPHKKYKNLKYKKNQLVVDIWKLTEHTNNLF